MGDDIFLRNLAQEDVLSVLRLGARSFDWPSEDVLWSEAQVQWYCDNARPSSFIAEHKGTIIGFVLCFSRGTIGYVGWLAVDPDWRRQGVGNRLMRQALKMFQSTGIQTATAIVREDGRADRLLGQFGFRDNGLRKLDMILSFGND